MPHWKSMMDRDFIYAFDLNGKDATLTIDRVSANEIKNGKEKQHKPFCWFREVKSGRALVLNATNCKTIAKLYGNNTDDWVGKRITLYPTTTQGVGGETVDCIRVRPVAPPSKKKTSTDHDIDKRDAQPSDDAQEQPAEREPGED